MQTKPKENLTQPLTQFSDNLSEWASEFYLSKKLEAISNRTLMIYQDQLGLFLKYCDAQLLENISQITPSTIRAFLTWLSETGHNAGGVHLAYRSLKTFLRWFDQEAEPEGWRNPISKIKAPKISEDPLEPVELVTVNKMIAACDDTFLGRRNKAILLFLLDTGLRARELLSLLTADVNLISGATLLRKGKGGKSREVFINPATRKALRAYLKMRTDSSSNLWVTRYFKPLAYGGLRVILEDVSKLAKVEVPSAHDFRRAFAINCLRNGMDLVTLSRLMGHANLKVLQRYLKMVNDDLREAHAKSSPVK